MAYQNKLSFASQMLNIYGIFVVKLSICAYLLILDFSPSYKRVIWVSPAPSRPVPSRPVPSTHAGLKRLTPSKHH
jgi:hypothetical protein